MPRSVTWVFSRCPSVMGVLIALIGSTVLAADTATHTVAAVPFRLTATCDGVFESPAITEVELVTAKWSTFRVESAIPHGTRVNKGDVLVRLETGPLDDEIRNLEIGERIAALAYGLLEREVALLKKATPLQLAMVRRARQIAAEDLARHEATEGKLEAENNDVMLAFSAFRRESAEEELEQLEKMYAQDDLTEETEEIVLKRARFDAEVARFYEKRMEDRHERVAALELPRHLEILRQTNRVAAIDLERAEQTLPVALDKLKLELEKSTFDRRKAAKHLAELKTDRAHMPLVAPTDGVVYFGRWHQGKWVDADQVAARLRTGGKLEPYAVLFSIVGSGRLFVRVSLPEKDLFKVSSDLPARIVPKAFPDTRIPGRVRSVSDVPVAAGRFEVIVELAEDHPRLAAGMEADVRVIAVNEPAVIAVPKEAVFTEELDDDKRFVYVVAGGGGKKPAKRSVATGRSNSDLVEITAGLTEGEQILLEKPKPTPAKTETKSDSTASAVATDTDASKK